MCTGTKTTLHLLRAQQNPPKDNLIAEWEADNPCVTVKVQEVPFGQLNDTITVSATGSNAPDVIEMDAPNTQSYASAGLLLPLDQYLPADYKTDVVKATLDEVSYQGKVYSPGLDQVSVALFYNKTLTDKAGIKPPTTLATAWTWDQALAAMRTCQQGPASNPTIYGLAPSEFGNGTPGYSYRDLMILRSAGNPKAAVGSSAYNTYYAISSDGSTVNGYINTPEDIAAAKVYQSMYSGSTAVTSKTGLPNAFIDGKACFDIQTSYLLSNLKTTPPKFAWSVTPEPYITTPVVHTGDVTMGVTAKTKYPSIAAKFVVDMSIGKEGEAFVKANNAFPVLQSQIKDFPEIQSDPPRKLMYDELVQWGLPRPPSPHFTQYDTLMTAALQSIALGADPTKTLNSAVTKIDAALKN